jgi:hypothetical protein
METWGGSSVAVVLDSKKRAADREAHRAELHAAELALSQARLRNRKAQSIEDRVTAAALKLRGANATATVAIIEGCNSRDRDIYLLAEEIGQARKTVLQQFPSVRKSVRAAYFGTEGEAASSAAEPDETPEAREEPTAEQEEDK